MDKIRWFLILLFCCFFPAKGIAQYWMQSGGSATIDEGLSVCADYNNNIYTTGYFTSSFDMNGQIVNSLGAEDIFISKMSGTGNLTWLIRAGGTSPERALSIDADSAGNFVITGYFYGSASFGNIQLTALGQQDIFIAKYDSSGTVVWAKRAGGSNSDQGNDVKFDHAGNIIVTGEFAGSCTFDSTVINSQAGSTDAFIAKYDANGNLLWVKKGSGNFNDRGKGIAIDLQNNVYISGMFSDTIRFDSVHPNTMLNSSFIIKLNPSGNEQWFRWLGSGTSINTGGIDYSSNGINLSGSFSGSLTFLGAASSTTITPTLQNNIYIGRINTTGNLEFLTYNGSDNDVSSSCITTKSNGDILIAGNFKCRFKDFSAQYGSGIFCSVGYEDNFVASYSNAGNWQWAKQFGGKKNDVVNSITIRNDSIPVFTGSYSDNYCVSVKFNQITNYGISNIDYDLQSAGTIYCNDSSYTDYVIYHTKGNSDVFVNSAINLSRQPLDYFNRNVGPCIKNYRNMCITGTTGNCLDTATTCSTIDIFFQPGFGQDVAYNYFLAPDFNFNWNNGSTAGFLTVAATGKYSATATSTDGCFTHSDSTYVIGSYQQKPMISDSKGINNGNSNPNSILLCAPDSVVLSCTNQGNSSISWTGATSGATTINVTNTGNYTCTLTNQYGCTSFTNISVVIATPITSVIKPKIKWVDDIDGNDSLTVCQQQIFEVFVYDSLSNPGGILSLCIPEMSMANYSIGASSGLFGFDLNTTCSNIPLSNKFFAINTGTFNLIVTVEVVRSNPCGSDTSYVTDTLHLTVNPANVGWLNFTVNGPEEFCPGGTATFVASPPLNNYQWQFDANGTIYTSNSNSLQVYQPGIYTVVGTYISVNSFGCTDSLVGVIIDTVSFFPQPDISLFPASGIICPNDSVQLNCGGSSIIDWYGPSGSLASGTNSIYSTNPGNYYCFQTVDSGCVLLSNTVSLMQYSSPSLYASPGSICINGSTTLNVISSPGSNIQWLPPLSGSSPVQTISAAGTYFCDVTSCGTTANLSVTIGTFPPVSPPSISFVPPNLISTTATTYQWFLNGFPIASANAQTFIPLQQGTYSVVITDSNGCSATSDPFLFTSLYEINYDEFITLSPNPASSYLHLIVSTPDLNLKDAVISIVDIQGQILLNERLSENLNISLNGFSNGIYFFEMISKNNLYRKKFIIQN